MAKQKKGLLAFFLSITEINTSNKMGGKKIIWWIDTCSWWLWVTSGHYFLLKCHKSKTLWSTDFERLFPATCWHFLSLFSLSIILWDSLNSACYKRTLFTINCGSISILLHLEMQQLFGAQGNQTYVKIGLNALSPVKIYRYILLKMGEQKLWESNCIRCLCSLANKTLPCSPTASNSVAEPEWPQR